MNKMDVKWAREHIAGFAKMQDSVISVKASEKEYAKLKNVRKEPVLPDLNRSTHPFSPFRIAQRRRDIEQRAVRRIWKLSCKRLFNKLLNPAK